MCNYSALLLTCDGLVDGPLLGDSVVGFTVGDTVKGANVGLWNEKCIEKHCGRLELARKDNCSGC